MSVQVDIIACIRYHLRAPTRSNKVYENCLRGPWRARGRLKRRTKAGGGTQKKPDGGTKPDGAVVRSQMGVRRVSLKGQNRARNGRPSRKKRGRPVHPQPHRTQSAFMKSISTYTWQRAHMHGTKRAHQCLDPTPSHRTSHRTSPPSTMSHAHSPRMEQHGTLDGDPLPNLRPTSLKQVSNHLHAPAPVGARRSRRLPPSQHRLDV